MAHRLQGVSGRSIQKLIRGVKLWLSQFMGFASLVPRPTPFFVLRFAFSIIHGGGRVRKRGRPGNTYHVNDVRWTRGGRRGGGAQLQVRAQ